MAHCTSCYNCGCKSVCDQWPIVHHVIIVVVRMCVINGPCTSCYNCGCKNVCDQWPIEHHVIIVVVRMCVINGPLYIML